MRLYCRVESERAGVQQGGNKYIIVSLTYERREIGRVILEDVGGDYKLSLLDENGSTHVVKKGEKQKGETWDEGGHGMSGTYPSGE